MYAENTMNTYTWSISKLDCTPSENGLTNVVKDIEWTFTGQDENGISSSISKSSSISSPDPEEFVDYSTLTEETIIGWLESRHIDDIEFLKLKIDSDIASHYKPPIISLPLPWITDEETVTTE